MIVLILQIYISPVDFSSAKSLNRYLALSIWMLLSKLIINKIHPNLKYFPKFGYMWLFEVKHSSRHSAESGHSCYEVPAKEYIADKCL